MKYWMLVLFTALIITPCLMQEEEKEKEKVKNKTNKKKERELMKKKANLVRYITNWDKYQIPSPIAVTILKDVLEKIALYKQNLYCPFGENECDPTQHGFADVMRQIIKDSIDNPANNVTVDVDGENNNGTNNGTNLLNGTNIDNGINLEEKKTARTQHYVNNPYPGIDFNYMKDFMSEMLQLGNLIHNQPLGDALRNLKEVFGVEPNF